MGQFGGLNFHTVTQVIAVDPAAGDVFPLMRAPEGGMTVVSFHGSNNRAQAAGTATSMALHNYGTAGTAIKAGAAGTVSATIGGTANLFAANTPIEAALTAYTYLEEGEWLMIDYVEIGGGWQATDRLHANVAYTLGKGV